MDTNYKQTTEKFCTYNINQTTIREFKMHMGNTVGLLPNQLVRNRANSLVVVVVVVGQTVGSISSKTLAYDCLCTLELCTASLIATS